MNKIQQKFLIYDFKYQKQYFKSFQKFDSADNILMMF